MTYPKVAVLVPCYNEEQTVAQVIQAFKAQLPSATIYVYDNNSKDQTAAVALKAGAVVRTELRQGKGNVVRRMFADVDADIYVMVDGDATYHAPIVSKMIEQLVSQQLDMLVGCRKETSEAAYRMGHRAGNWMFTQFVALLFGQSFSDVFSGYRVFSRRFVKSFPCTSRGFEIETEITVHCLDMGLPVAEIDTPYAERPEGSMSKLSTYRDGFRILRMIMLLAKEIRPLAFFSTVAALFALVSVDFGVPVVLEYLETHLVPRQPTAVLAAGLMIISVLVLVAGIILDSVSRGRKELKKLFYLQHSVS